MPADLKAICEPLAERCSPYWFLGEQEKRFMKQRIFHLNLIFTIVPSGNRSVGDGSPNAISPPNASIPKRAIPD